MDKDKLIEKLKKEKLYIDPINRTIVFVSLNESEIDLILTSMTAPVPDGKEEEKMNRIKQIASDLIIAIEELKQLTPKTPDAG